MKHLMAGLGVFLAAAAHAADVSLDLKVSDVKVFKADKPGARTCEFTAAVTVKNIGKEGVVGSKRALEFTLTGPDGKAVTSPPLGTDTPPNLADAFLMPPGGSKTYTVKFHMNGAGVEPGKPYKLKVVGYDTSDEKKVEFKEP
jgi:hypothetical protein